MNSSTSKLIFLLFFGSGIIISTPFLSGFVLLLMYSLNAKDDTAIHWQKYIGTLSIVASYSLINFNKEIENDLVWYSEHFFYHFGGNILDIFSTPYSGVIAKSTEPLYHIFSFLISNITYSNYFLYIASITALIYFPLSIIIIKVSNRLNFSPIDTSILLFFFLTMSMTFTLTAHLIRQYIAISFLSCMIYNLVLYNNRRTILFSIISILTHNATLPIIIIILIVHSIHYLFRNKSRSVILLLTCSITIFLTFLVIETIVWLGDGNRLHINDGAISAVVKYIDGSIFVISILCYLCTPKRNNIISFLYIIYFSFFTFILYVQNYDFLALRYYFFLDVLRWIPVMLILYSFSFKKITKIIMLCISLPLGVFYLDARFNTSPFDFNGSIYYYILYPLNSYI
jgi:hypothetical protein